MDVGKNFIVGLLSVLKITGAPLLYRYPYHISGEGLRADWQKIGNDMRHITDQMAQENYDEQ